jgi:uncharacterized membrane protein
MLKYTLAIVCVHVLKGTLQLFIMNMLLPSLLRRVFFSYSNIVESAIVLTSLLKARISRDTLKTEMEEHPDYPGLVCMGDALERYGVENVTAVFEPRQLDIIPLPFVTTLKIKDELPAYFTVVNSVGKEAVSFYDPFKHCWRVFSRSQFEKRWTGTVLIADVNPEAGESDYKKKRRKEVNDLIVNIGLITGIFVLFLSGSLYPLMSLSAGRVWPGLMALLNLAGFIIALLILAVELDAHHSIVKQFCSMGRQVNCSAVIHSKGARIGNFSWGMIGAAWFLANLLILFASGLKIGATLFYLFLFDLPATGFVVYSIWYQWKVLRQWCALCLAVQGVLVIQAVGILASGILSYSRVSDLMIYPAIYVVTIFLFCFLCMAWLIPVFRNAKSSGRYRLELQRIKKDPVVFSSLLQKQRTIEGATAGLGITLGNPLAANTIIKVCNPYCGPCALAHPLLDELIDNNPDLKLQVIFAATSREGDKRNIPVKHFMAIAAEGDSRKTRKALDDWYGAREKDYEVFAAMHPAQWMAEEQDIKVKAMEEWCNREQIAFTPTIFINGHQLPPNYSVKDLKYFLSV